MLASDGEVKILQLVNILNRESGGHKKEFSVLVFLDGHFPVIHHIDKIRSPVESQPFQPVVCKRDSVDHASADPLLLFFEDDVFGDAFNNLYLSFVHKEVALHYFKWTDHIVGFSFS